MAHRLAPHAHAVFWRGALAITFAVAVFAWPLFGPTVLVLIFGVFAMIDGAMAFSMAMREAPRTRWSIALMLEGVTGVVIGAFGSLLPAVAGGWLVGLIAAWALLTGALEILAASAIGSDRATTVALLAGGAASILLGGTVIAWPALGTSALAQLLGGYAVAFGAVLVALSIRLRRSARPRGHAQRPVSLARGGTP
ncbi:MAG: DUF308 domain-containing protein [Deltaproteobacteria bacterium]|nr:DUF308 domain-containing protein [Deltaproteobacteria bacterium]